MPKQIICDKPTPTEEGVYLWKPSSEILPAELITVRKYPSYGDMPSKPQSYLGVGQMRGRNVAALRGKFSDKLEII